jgi:hypothetical protein
MSQAELPVIIGSPALHRMVGHQRTGVVGTSRDRDGSAPKCNQAILVGLICAPIFDIAEAQLTLVVGPPAAHVAFRKKGTGMSTPCDELYHLRQFTIRLAAITWDRIAIVAGLGFLDFAISTPGRLADASLANTAALCACHSDEIRTAGFYRIYACAQKIARLAPGTDRDDIAAYPC